MRPTQHDLIVFGQKHGFAPTIVNNHFSITIGIFSVWVIQGNHTELPLRNQFGYIHGCTPTIHHS
jgi:hypothetical protein